MNELASRKHLLLAESELNRAQLAQEWATMTAKTRALASQTKTVTTLAAVIAGLAFFRRRKTTPAAEKSSWWQTLLKGAETVGSLWTAFRAHGRQPGEN